MTTPLKDITTNTTDPEARQAEIDATVMLHRTHVNINPNDLLNAAAELPDVKAQGKGVLDRYRDTVIMLLDKGYKDRKISEFFNKNGITISVTSVRNFRQKLEAEKQAQAFPVTPTRE